MTLPHLAPPACLALIAGLLAFAPLAEAEVFAPVLSPSTADSTVGIDVTITCDTPGAEIRYTLNGADPIFYDQPVVSGTSIRISRNAVLKVRAWLGSEASPVVTEDYRITGAVSNGYQHGLALSVTGRVWSWGEQGSGRLGNGSTASADVITPGRVLLPPDNFEIGALIAAGQDHSLVVDQSRQAWAFGENGSGQLGNNSTTDSALPVRVLKSATAGDFLGAVTAADAGQNFSLALLENGTPVTWGSQSSGRLGNGVNSSSSRKYADPVKNGSDPAFPDLTGIRAIAAGNGHGLAREANATEVPAATGRVWVWGSNGSGQLGRGNVSPITRAQPLLLNAATELTHALDISGGGSHTAIVRWEAGNPDLDGTVWSCGNQSAGRLGNGLTASGDVTYPVKAIKVGGAPLTGIRQVSAGPSHTLALDADGHVWAWGDNSYGQLGDGTTTDNGHARLVLGANGTGTLEDIVMVTAGGESTNGRSMALAEDGTIWVWGRNNEGQLGNGQVAATTILPVAHAQNHVAEGAPSVTLTKDVGEPQEAGEVMITAARSHTNPAVNLNQVGVAIYRNGDWIETLQNGATLCPMTGLEAGTYHIYAVATDPDGVTAMSAAQTVTIFEPDDFIATPANGSTRTTVPPGPLEYWVEDGEKSIKLNVALDFPYHGSVVTAQAFDSSTPPKPLTASVTGSGATRRITVGLYGYANAVVSPVTITGLIDGDPAWTTAYRPRAVTWEISQPITALNGSTPVTLPGTRFRHGEIAKLVRSEGGSYKVRSTFNIDTFGDPALNGGYEMVLRGLPDQVAQIAPASTTSHGFDFKIPTFALSAPDIRFDLVRSTDGVVIRSTPVSLHGRSSGTGIQYSGTAWKLSYDETTDEGYKQECGNCGNESGTETFSYLNRDGSMCAAGYLSPDSTPDNHVDASYDLGTSAAGAGGMKADFKTDDLSDPGIASPENMELSGTESPQVTTDLGGTYAETIQTATGITRVTDIQADGYTLTFTGTGQSIPTTSLRIVRTELAANQWSLRFIEKRHLGTIVETRYEQTKNSDGSETWKILEGAELSTLADPAAAENSFLRRTTILRSATAVVSVTPLLGTSPAPIPQFTEQVTVDEMTADTSAWETVSVTLNTFRVFPWGDPIVSQVLDPVTVANPAGRALTRRWDYHTQTGGAFGNATGGPTSDRPGTLAGFQDYDGFWQQLTWDSEGRIAKVRSPFLSTTSTAADTACEVWTFTYGPDTRSDTHTIQGVIVGESVASGTESTRYLARRATPGEAAGSLVTTVTRAPVAVSTTNANFKFAADSYRITSIARPDGTVHTCDWSYIGANLVKSCTDGNAAGDKGTTTLTTSDLIGNATTTVSGVLDFGGAAGTPQNLSTVTRDLLDPLGRPTRSTTSFTDGSPSQAETWTYSCCGILNSTDHRGILTHYHHDHLKRRESSTTLDVVHGTQYNGRERLQLRIPRALVPAGQVMSAERITFRGLASFPVGTILQGETVTNLAGETTHERSPSPQHSDGTSLQTTTVQYLYSGGNRVIRNFPDGGQSVTWIFTDRRLCGKSGSAEDQAGYTFGLPDSLTPEPVTLWNGAVFAQKVFLGNVYGFTDEWVITGYDLLGRPVITLYPDGATATQHYNDLGQLIKSIDPDGVTTLFAYNDEGERTHSAADLNGNGVLDLATDRVTLSETNATTAPDGSTKTWQTLSRVYREGDSGESGGLVAGLSHRSIDGLKSWSVPFGLTARTSTSVTVLGGNGAWTSTSVAADGLTTVSTTTGGLLRTSIVRGANAVETVSSTGYLYDAHNRVETTTDARTGASTVAFNNADQATSTTLERGAGTADNLTTSYGFDQMGRTLTVDSPDAASTEGNLANIVTRIYDKRGNVTKISGEQTYDVDYTYDSLSRMKTLTTIYSGAYAYVPQTTTWLYDPMRGWLVEKNYSGEDDNGVDDPDYKYTLGGRLRTRTWERGVVTTYHYDFHAGYNTGFGTAARAGDLAAIAYTELPGDPTTPDLGYKYKRWGAVREIQDITGTRLFTYRTAIDLQTESEETTQVPLASGGIAIPKKCVHAYDSLGRMTNHRVGSPDGTLTDHAVQYGFDPQTGRLKDIVHGDTGFGIPQLNFTQTHVPNSDLVHTVNGPIQRAENSWEPHRDVLLSRINYKPSNFGLILPTLSTFYGEVGTNEAVNAIGQRLKARYQEGYGDYAMTSATYEYNANGEVELAVRRDETGTPLPGQSLDYFYDPIGNREVTGVDGVNVVYYSPNEKNQYDEIETSGILKQPAHDLDGNLVNDGSKRYVWDAENRLIEVRQATGDALVASYRYDYMSRRIHKETTALAPQGAGETVFHYEGWNLCAEYPAAAKAIGTATTVRRTYTWGSDLSGTIQGAGGVGGLLAVEEKSGTHVGVHYPLYDGNGNVMVTIKAAGPGTEVTSAYRYDAFGNTVYQTGGYADEMPFRFSSKYFDKETGFYYYGYRFYDPVTGRWPSRDPIGEEGGLNLYAFVANNGVNGTDFLGLQCPPAGYADEGWDEGQKIFFSQMSGNDGSGSTLFKGGRNGRDFLNHLESLTQQCCCIKDLRYAGHGGPNGLGGADHGDAGFYGVSPEANNQIGKNHPMRKARDMDDLKPLISNGRIKFCADCIIKIHACGLSAEFIELLARTTGCRVVGGSASCYSDKRDRDKHGNDTAKSRWINDGGWMQSDAGAPVTILPGGTVYDPNQN